MFGFGGVAKESVDFGRSEIFGIDPEVSHVGRAFKPGLPTSPEYRLLPR